MGQTQETHAKTGPKISLPGCLVLSGVLLIGAYTLLNAFFFRSHGDSRRSICSSNMRQVSLSIFKYEVDHNRYPGYVEMELVDGIPRMRPYMFVLLPTMELRDLYERYQGYAGEGLPPDEPFPHLPFLVCPSHPVFEGPVCDFVINTGLPDGKADANTPADWGANGVFHSAFPFDNQGAPIAITNVASGDIQDGLAQTLMVSESLAPRNWYDMQEAQVGMVWQPTLNPPPAALMKFEPDLAANPYLIARPSSNHPDAVNVFFCDNHYQVLNTSIDYRVYCQLLAPQDSAVRPPGVNSNMQIPGEIITTPLQKDDYR